MARKKLRNLKDYDYSEVAINIIDRITIVSHRDTVLDPVFPSFLFKLLLPTATECSVELYQRQ